MEVLILPTTNFFENSECRVWAFFFARHTETHTLKMEDTTKQSLHMI